MQNKERRFSIKITKGVLLIKNAATCIAFPQKVNRLTRFKHEASDNICQMPMFSLSDMILLQCARPRNSMNDAILCKQC